MLTRQKEFLQWLVGGFSTSALIVGGVWLSENRDMVIAEVTGSAVTSPTKLEVLEKHSEASLTTEEHKASGNMIVSLVSADGRKSDGSLTIAAHVTAQGDLNDLKYEWVLPDGVLLMSGSASGSLGTLTDGVEAISEVTLNVPPTNAQVIFHAYREMAGEKIGQVAHYNTVEQQSLDVKLALKREDLSRRPASNDRRFE